MKNNVTKLRRFKKAHILCGAKTNIITYIDVTDGYASDCKVFPSLVKNTARYYDFDEVSADKAYSSRENLDTVFNNGAIPYISFKKNATGKARGTPIWKAMYKYFKENNGEFMKHYHLRSNAEATFSMIKRKYGSNLRMRTDMGQENEVLCKALVHNICVLITEIFNLGIKVEFSEVDSKWKCDEENN